MLYFYHGYRNKFDLWLNDGWLLHINDFRDGLTVYKIKKHIMWWHGE